MFLFFTPSKLVTYLPTIVDKRLLLFHSEQVQNLRTPSQLLARRKRQ